METESKRTSGQVEPSPGLAEIRVIHPSNPPLERNMAESRAKEPLMKRLMRWIVPDQRVANRHAMPPLIAYLGLVRSSKEYKVGDISVAGFYMVTEERWILGTGFPVTLERIDEMGQGQTLTVYSTVVRTGPDGVGFSFLRPANEEQHATEAGGAARLDLTKVAQFLRGLPLSEAGSDAFEQAS